MKFVVILILAFILLIPLNIFADEYDELRSFMSDWESPYYLQQTWISEETNNVLSGDKIKNLVMTFENDYENERISDDRMVLTITEHNEIINDGEFFVSLIDKLREEYQNNPNKKIFTGFKGSEEINNTELGEFGVEYISLNLYTNENEVFANCFQSYPTKENNEFTLTHWCIVGKFSLSQSISSNEYFVGHSPRELTHVAKSIQEKYDYPITDWNDILLDVNAPYVDRTGNNGLITLNDSPTVFSEESLDDENIEKIITQQESDICNSSAIIQLEGPISWMVLEYKAGTNKAFRANFSNEEFGEYLKEIDYRNSERATEYVNSITSSKEFATFYTDRNLVPEEEKLLIQISEKYLEFLNDGKNGFVADVNTLYTDKKNEINAIPMQDSRLTICGDDKILGLEEFEEIREATQYMISHNISDTVEDWGRNLELKQSKFPTDFPKEESTQLTNDMIPGEIGLKKGDWAKYEIIFGGEGGFASMLDIMKNSYEITGLDCKFSDMEWIKSEVIDIQNNQPIMKGSISCDGEEHSLTNTDDNIFQNVNQFYIPIDIEVGGTITLSDKEFTVSEPDAKMYGSKTVEVIRLYSEDIELYENGGKSKTIDESFFEKESGLLLEKTMIMEATGVPLFGDMTFTFGLDAIEYNTPRTILSQPSSNSGGGCLIATATYGSELAPQVQQLRELRDNSLLQTESGTNFMNLFNDFYYSFSPIIADYERENLVFKEGVKLFITPMISTLSIMTLAEEGSESQVLGLGISIILLNLGIYVVGPVIGITKIKKHIQRKQTR